MVMRSQPASDRGTPVSGVLLERDVELDLLAELLRDVDARRGRSLLFEAAAGLRKSALLEHAVSAGREAGLVVLRGRGHQLERGFAWGVARSLFEASLWGSARSERERLLDGPAAPARPVFGDHDGRDSRLGAEAGFAIMPRCTGWRCGWPSASRCSRRRHRRARWQPTVRCGLGFDFLDLVVSADGTPYASLVDGCTAEECESRLGRGSSATLVSGPGLGATADRDRGGAATARHAAAALSAAAANPAAAATA